MENNVIRDGFGRIHDYLRISIIDKCNLRCTYCMPEHGIEFLKKRALMTLDEIYHLASTFTDLGIKKIRLTGGEPLVRHDFPQLLDHLSELPVDISITSNGFLVDRFIHDLKRAGVKAVNISLDSLKEEKFESITRKNYLDKVKNNIQLLIDHDIIVKVNNVVMKDVNEDELLDFVAWTQHTPISIRFIEYMPFNGNHWDYEKVVSFQEIMERVKARFEVEALPGKASDTAKNYQIKGAKGTFGIISTITNPFCEGCNRIRITADGKLKNCLFSTEEVDLLSSIRQGEEIKALIFDCFSRKHFSRGGLAAFDAEGVQGAYEENRSMIRIGG